MDELTPIKHGNGCGRLAFHYRGRPVPGALMDPARAVLFDGSTPARGSVIICGSCGEPVNDPNALTWPTSPS